MRRLAVALAAATLPMFVWAASPALSAAPFAARAVDFEQPLDRGAGIRGLVHDRGSYVSPVIRAPERFDLVGLTWPARGHASSRIRVRDPHGHWSAWTAMGDRHGGGRGGGSEPVWTGGADAYQLRFARRPPRGLRAHFVNTTGGATATDRARSTLLRAAHNGGATLARAQTTGAGAGAPAIVPRAAWGADQCPPRFGPSYGEVRMGFVHHTVSTNDYGPQDSAAMVLAICRFHRNANGWRDIGYNFLVDRYGTVFEGRAGGIDQPVVGAQAQGYNSVSTGIANIGTFTSAAPTPAALHATAQLLAWKLSLHGVPVTGRVTVTSGGGASNRFKAGERVAFPRISGHRDADSTECPGGALYARLDEIRAQAAALAPLYGAARGSGLTLQADDRTLDFPQAAQLSGRFAGSDGAALGAATVSLQIAGGSGFRTSRHATTRSDGSWSVALPTAYSRTLRALAQRPDGSLATSEQLRVVVAPRIRMRVAGRVGARRLFTVSGSVRPRRGRLTLEVRRKGSRGTLRTVLRIPVKVRSGRFAVRLRLRRAGLHRLRVMSSADARNASASSSRSYVRVVRRGHAR